MNPKFAPAVRESPQDCRKEAAGVSHAVCSEGHGWGLQLHLLGWTSCSHEPVPAHSPGVLPAASPHSSQDGLASLEVWQTPGCSDLRVPALALPSAWTSLPWTHTFTDFSSAQCNCTRGAFHLLPFPGSPLPLSPLEQMCPLTHHLSCVFFVCLRH